MAARWVIAVDKGKCIGCGDCVKVCLTGALRLGEDGRSELVDERLCDGFGSCITTCQENALYLELREAEEFDWSLVTDLSLEDLMKKLRQTAYTIYKMRDSEEELQTWLTW